MSQAPYSPMHGPLRHVSEDKMWEVLRRHVPDAVPKRATPKAELRKPLPPLEWETAVRTGPNSGYALSKCGRYSVSMDSVMGKSMFTAWRRKQGETPEHMIGIRDQPQEAKVLCEKDRE